MKPFCFFLLLSVVGARAEVVFHETFANGRETDDPPQSLAWRAVVPDSVKVEDGALVLSGADESRRAVIAMFPEVGLKPGDRLILTFGFTVTGEIGSKNGLLRMGLYSIGNFPGEDGEDPNTDGTGYLVSFNGDKSVATPYWGNQFFARVVDGMQRSDPPLTSYQNHLVLKQETGGMHQGSFESEMPYSVEFEIEPVTETSVRLVSRIFGGLFFNQNESEVTTNASEGTVFTDFNALVLAINADNERGGFPQVAFSNIQLEVFRK